MQVVDGGGEKKYRTFLKIASEAPGFGLFLLV